MLLLPPLVISSAIRMQIMQCKIIFCRVGRMLAVVLISICQSYAVDLYSERASRQENQQQRHAYDKH